MSKLKITIKNFYPVLKKYIGIPFNYLEIGVFRGTTIEWILNTIATDEECVLVGIDPWERKLLTKRDVRSDADWNDLLNKIARIKDMSDGKIQLVRNYSHRYFKNRPFPDYKFDAIYIDGNHTTLDVLRDFCYTWDLLRQNGVLIFDDYNQEDVKIAVDTILYGLKGNYNLLFSNQQLGIRKINNEKQ